MVIYMEPLGKVYSLTKGGWSLWVYNVESLQVWGIGSLRALQGCSTVLRMFLLGNLGLRALNAAIGLGYDGFYARSLLQAFSGCDTIRNTPNVRLKKATTVWGLGLRV